MSSCADSLRLARSLAPFFFLCVFFALCRVIREFYRKAGDVRQWDSMHGTVSGGPRGKEGRRVQDTHAGGDHHSGGEECYPPLYELPNRLWRNDSFLVSGNIGVINGFAVYGGVLPSACGFVYFGRSRGLSDMYGDGCRFRRFSFPVFFFFFAFT